MCQPQARQRNDPLPTSRSTSRPTSQSESNPVVLTQGSASKVGRNPKPKSQPGYAIQSGADCLLALFEEERQRHEAHYKAQLVGLEAKFYDFRAIAQEEGQKLAARVLQLEAELERKNADTLLLLQREGHAKDREREQVQEAREAGVRPTGVSVERASINPAPIPHTVFCVADGEADPVLLERIDGKTARLLRQLVSHLDQTAAQNQDGSATGLELTTAKVGTVPDVFIPALAEYLGSHKTVLQVLDGKRRAVEQERDSLQHKVKRKCEGIRALEEQVQTPPPGQQRPASGSESENEEQDKVPEFGLVSKARESQTLEVCVLEGQANSVVLAELDGGTVRLLRRLAVHIVQAAAQTKGETAANSTRIEALPDVFIPALAQYLVSYKKVIGNLEEKCRMAKKKRDLLRGTLDRKRAKFRDLHRKLSNARNCEVWQYAYMSPATSGSESENKEGRTGEVKDDNGDKKRMRLSVDGAWVDVELHSIRDQHVTSRSRIPMTQ